MKILFVISALATMFSSSACECPNLLQNELIFEVYNNGYKVALTSEDVEKFDTVFNEVLQSSRPMPALGVSLHNETMKAVENGIWVRYAFDKTCVIDEMPFDQLLIKFSKDMYGFDVIRGNNGVFEGRNYYIDIHQNLDDAYNFLISLPVSQEKFNSAINCQLQTVKSFEENNIKIKEVFAESVLPSINKDNKDKNTVIKQEGEGGTEKDYEHMIQWNNIKG